MSLHTRSNRPGKGSALAHTDKYRRIAVTLDLDTARQLANEAIRHGVPLAKIIRDKVTARLNDERQAAEKAKDGRTAAWFSQPWT